MSSTPQNKLHRIAFLITELEIGGAERCLTNLALGIDRRRFAPLVYSLGPRPTAGDDQFVLQLEEAAVPVHFLNIRSAWQAPSALRQLRRLLRNQRVDLLQTFLFHANVLGALSARSVGISHLVGGVRVADPNRWRLWIERCLVNRFERIVCVSQSVADFVRLRGGFPMTKLRVIPNGIDMECYSPKVDASTRRPVLLCVGRLDRQKGFDWLLEMAPDILGRLPTHELHIVGDGPERDALQRQADASVVRDRIRFLGRRDDVPEILASSSVLLLPSRWEGMPNVLLEAMAAGLPVVAANVEGVGEVMGDLGEQQLVPWGNSARFISATVEFVSDANLAADLGKRNHARIASTFALASMIAQYEHLYEELLSR